MSDKKPTSVRFRTIQFPVFQITVGNNDLKNLPKVVRTRDLELFKKECMLVGWKISKERNRMQIHDSNGAIANYKRKRKLWIKMFCGHPYETPLTELFFLGSTKSVFVPGRTKGSLHFSIKKPGTKPK